MNLVATVQLFYVSLVCLLNNCATRSARCDLSCWLSLAAKVGQTYIDYFICIRLMVISSNYRCITEFVYKLCFPHGRRKRSEKR